MGGKPRDCGVIKPKKRVTRVSSEWSAVSKMTEIMEVEPKEGTISFDNMVVIGDFWQSQ